MSTDNGAPSKIITLLTDFGTHDVYVGAMKGVVLGICPEAKLVDLTHEVPPQAVLAGALLLRQAVEYFPKGSVHLAVVDPGVGTERSPLVVVTDAGCLVGPDNGLLHPAALALGLREVRRLECEQYFRKPVSQTFHGRDIFAPVAAQLARGVSPAALGPVIESFQALDIPEPRRGGEEICGQVIYVDRFGNLITNIPASLLSGFAKGGLSIRIGQVHSAPLVPAYAAVREGSLLGVVGSWGLLEIAVSRGSAAERLQCGIGTIVRCVGD